MTDYRPVSRRAYCGEDHWRAIVEVVDGSSTRQVEADVDVNPSDGTANPRITIRGGQPVDVNQGFVSSFRALPAATAGIEEQQRICGQPPAQSQPTPPPDDHVGWGWLVFPLIGPLWTQGSGYALRRASLNDLRVVSPDASLTHTLDGVAIGTDALTTVTYTLIEPRLTDMAAGVSDGVYGTWGLVMCGVGVFARGNNHGPEMHQCASSILNIGSARAYRHLGQGWGSLIEMGAGGATLGLAFAFPGTRMVTDRDLAAPATLPPGSRDIEGNPLESVRYPASRIDFIGLGATHIGNGLIHGMYAIFADRPPPLTAPRLSVTTVPSGGYANMSFNF